MLFTNDMREKFRREAEREREPQHRCSNCRHLLPHRLEKPPIYTGDDGTCQLLAQLISNAHRSWCSGWQDDIFPRREAASVPKGWGTTTTKDAILLIRRLAKRLSKSSPNNRRFSEQALDWLRRHTRPDRDGILRDHIAGGE